MPARDGRFKGISVPRLPWLEDTHEGCGCPLGECLAGESPSYCPLIYPPDGWVKPDEPADEHGLHDA